MANVEHQIAGHRFAVLLGHWLPPRPHVERNQRPGTDGTEHTRTGTRGEPFTLTSITDVADYKAGLKEFDKYLKEIGKNPVPLILNEAKSEDHGFLVQVENVTLQRCAATGIIVGGRKKDAEAILVCRWHLIAVKDK